MYRISDTWELLEKYRLELKLSTKVLLRATDLIQKYDALEKPPRYDIMPRFKATSALYIASILIGEYRTQREIAKASNSSVGSIIMGLKKFKVILEGEY